MSNSFILAFLDLFHHIGLDMITVYNSPHHRILLSQRLASLPLDTGFPLEYPYELSLNLPTDGLNYVVAILLAFPAC